jgi:phage repressor protein C with HTH and peptisase S24 domain
MINQLLVENRRARLKEWIDSNYKGVVARFIDATDINQGEVSGLLKSKSFGEKKARSLEEKAGMPYGWLDTLPTDKNKKEGAEKLTLEEHLPPGAFFASTSKLNTIPVIGKGMGGLPDRMFTDEGMIGLSGDEYAEIYSSDTNAFVFRVDGNSMFPKYHHGGFALAEPNTPAEIEDDVLLKTTSGKVMLKRLVSRRGGITLSSYNETETYSFSDDEIVWMYYVAYPVPNKKIKNRL